MSRICLGSCTGGCIPQCLCALVAHMLKESPQCDDCVADPCSRHGNQRQSERAFGDPLGSTSLDTQAHHRLRLPWGTGEIRPCRLRPPPDLIP